MNLRKVLHEYNETIYHFHVRFNLHESMLTRRPASSVYPIQVTVHGVQVGKGKSLHKNGASHVKLDVVGGLYTFSRRR